jgi:hypothetical protein
VNADLNARADRSNVIFTSEMGNNLPKDYIGYSSSISDLTWQQQVDLSTATVLANAPCYNPAIDSSATAQACYNTIMRLAYLNQESDIGSLVLREGYNCLTLEQLNAITNVEIADNHPLNCAKMNAKPYPYFDGGLMIMKKSGWFPYFSSRNNNFSNRQNMGVVCVGSSNCKVDSATGILQNGYPSLTNDVRPEVNMEPSTCVNSANGMTGATANGAHTCLPSNSSVVDDHILTVETFAIQVREIGFSFIFLLLLLLSLFISFFLFSFFLSVCLSFFLCLFLSFFFLSFCLSFFLSFLFSSLGNG